MSRIYQEMDIEEGIRRDRAAQVQDMVHDITTVGLNEAREYHEEEGRIPREDSLRNMRPFEPSVAVILLSIAMNVDRCILDGEIVPMPLFIHLSRM